MNDNKRSEMHSAKLVYQEEIEIASESQLLERGSHIRASSDLSRHGEREGGREGGGGGVEQANGLGNDREKGVRVDVSGGREAGGEGDGETSEGREKDCLSFVHCRRLPPPSPPNYNPVFF